MISKRPVRLTKEPIVDALFEVRLAPAAIPLSNAVPGLLFSAFSAESPVVARLPGADMPAQLKALQPQFMYQPVLAITLGKFRISVGDRIVTVGCKLPYPGWAEFKQKIISVWDKLGATGLLPDVERYSMKYVDLISAEDAPTPFGPLDMKISVAGRALSDEMTVFRTEFISESFVEALQVISRAEVQVEGQSIRSGMVLDIDILSRSPVLPSGEFVDSLSERLEAIHEANKELFFGCLTDEVLVKLGAVYE